jgi:predicted ATPase/DNA-binding SARP family transcriptional activator
MVPEPLTPLLGRDADVAETLRLLDGARLVTLTGAGGSGKTRLALEVAHRIGDGGVRAVWVDLAGIAEAELIAQQIGGALQIRQAGARDLFDEIIDTLRKHPTLLVLDNCEHLIDDVARLAERILRACPETTILATSREPLAIAGERTWLVPPLANPDAVKLFAERARAVLPVFALEAHNTHAVEIICARLDGIPLAIELAAARVKVLAVWQIADRLNDAFRLLSAGSRNVPRHRTIRETIDWSFRLLSETEQVLFRRLAVFPATFSLEAAEAICGDGVVDRDAIFDLLSALVDKSLVVCDRTAGKARYRLLETVRQFATEKLVSADERDRFRAAHAEHFFALAGDAEPRLFAGHVDAGVITLIDDEIANLRAVIDWAEEDASRANFDIQIVYSLRWYWFARGQFTELRRRSDAAFARRGLVEPRVRGLAAISACDGAIWQADWQSLVPLAAEAVALLRNDENLRLRAVAYLCDAVAQSFARADCDKAAEQFAAALRPARACGVPITIALVLHWSGTASMLRGDFDTARKALEEAVRVGIEIDAKPAIGHPSTLLGYVAIREGRYRDAAIAFARAVEAFVQIDDRWGLAHVVEGVALLLIDTGENEIGTRLLAAASAAWLQLGARPVHHAHVESEANERIQRAMSDDRLRVALASGTSMTHDAMVALVREELARFVPTGGSATSPAVAAEAPLIVRALGPLEIIRNGVTLDVSSVPARAREMLVYLLCQRRGCTKEQLGAALWPDADAAKLRNNFHVTLHRLRKLLGDGDWIVVDGETYSVAKNVDFDVDTFEREAKAKRFENAIALYRGPFLASAATAEWADEVRDRLRNVYAGALTQHARARTAAGDLHAATEAYEKLFATDALDEEACRNLMLTLAKQGDTGGATRAYRRLTESLRRELDAQPAPATVMLHAKIVSGQV